MEKDSNKSRKDEILKTSPFLAVFVNSGIQEDYLNWLSAVDHEFISKRDELSRILGDKLIDKDLNVFLYVANEYKVFRQEISQNTRYALIACFAWMGFEIGSRPNVSLFLNDVMNQLKYTDCLSEKPENKDYVGGIMKCGANWREDVAQDLQDVWKDAIGKLKF